MRRFIFWSFLVLVALSVQMTQAAEVRLFILAGQSNAYGQPVYPDDNPPVLPGDASIGYYFAGNTPVGTEATLATRYDNIVGPEVGLGRALQAALPGQKIAIYKYAVGGTALGEWQKVGGLIYPKFISGVQSFENTIIAQGDTPVLSGFAWSQGENGATNNWDAWAWADNHNDPIAWRFREDTRQFITDVRTDLGAPSMFAMETRISDLFYNSQSLSATVAAQQNEITNTLPLVIACIDHRRREQEAVPTVLSRCALVSQDGVTHYPLDDPAYPQWWYHFTPSSYLMVGGRMATAYLDNAFLKGDANRDDHVTFADYQILEAHFGQTGQTWLTGDFDKDGTVTFADYQALEANFGQSTAPEPATLGLLAAGALALIRRRR
jgi:hypothetical protein